MVVQIAIDRIHIPPGQRVWLSDVGWQEFEAILVELGDRSARIAYDNGMLELMTPLPEHEAAKEIIGDLLKALLEELEIEFLTLGSTTFKNQQMAQAIEPDQCFYIQNEAKVRGKQRLDLAIDPPPDLAIEIDITSRTHPHIYAALNVPELWRFEQGKLQIYRLRSGEYQQVAESPTFPSLALSEAIVQFASQSRKSGRNTAIRAFRAWVRQLSSE
jgi:Uma2 family endonuclease